MSDALQAPDETIRSRRLMALVFGIVLLLALLVASRQFVSRTASSAPSAAEDCEEEPPPSSFTLADCDAEGKPLKPSDPAAPAK